MDEKRKNKGKRRRIYKELEIKIGEDEKTKLDKSAQKFLKEALIAARKEGKISDMLGSDGGDIADKLKTLAKGGEVKKYMGGGSVHNKKNKMATTKGWGASRKT